VTASGMIVLEDGNQIPLGPPTTLDQTLCCKATVQWVGLNVLIPAGSWFKVQTDWQGAMGGTRFESLTVRFPGDGDPLPAPPSGSNVTCTSSSVSIGSSGNSLCP